MLGGYDKPIAGFDYDDNGNRSKLTYFLDGSKAGNKVSVDYTHNACECRLLYPKSVDLPSQIVYPSAFNP